MTDALRDELNELLVANGKREEDLHAAGACSDAILSQLRVQAFIDAIVEHLGIPELFALALERQKAQAQEAIFAQVSRSKLAVPGAPVVPLDGGRR